MGFVKILNRPVFHLLDGDVSVWIEQRAIRMRALDRPYHDPVELSAGAGARRSAARDGRPIGGIGRNEIQPENRHSRRDGERL